ncbi:MAG TPA: NB-ARC domain-containing protein [Acidimicrobiia bacterium]|nr:NB-ARC domain-containing protein [Acidimicrobiia bacterium]
MVEIGYHNLPTELTTFVGRAAEIRTLSGLLDTSRLVSLTGPGGVGKSRLATQVAVTIADGFPDGVWYIDLTSTDDGDQIPSVVAESFAVGDIEVGGLRERGEVVADFLSDRHILLILDNCEHVLGAVRTLTKTLLSACPGVQILATTREILGMNGEMVFRVAPLPVETEIEGERPEAVRLFLDRAAQVRAGYQADSEAVEVIGEIVRRLDGLPLAIEVAASRTKLLSPSQILDRLADRFRFLESSAGRPSRHETIQATIDWSYNLLDRREQEALQRLAVFNGWSLEGAEAVLGEVDETFEILEGLVDKSLVDVVLRGSENRYRLLETVRQFALERLAEAGLEEEARLQHGSYTLALAERGDQGLRGHDQAQWVERIKADHDNIRAAVGWALGGGHIEHALRVVAAMGRYWFMQTEWKDALRWFRRVSELSGPEHDLLWARAFIKTGAIELITRGSPSDPDAGERAHRILEEQGSMSERAMSLYALAEARSMTTGAEETIRASIALFQEAGDQWGEAYAKRWLGSKVELLGDARQNIAHQREAVEGFINLGDHWSAGWLAFDLGFSLLAVAEYVEADQAFDKALGLVANIDERLVVAHATRGKASVAAGLGRPQEARRLFRDAIPMFERIGDQSCVAFSHLYLADVESELGDLEDVVSLLSKAIDGFVETRNPPGVSAVLRRLARAVTSVAPEIATRLLAVDEGGRTQGAALSPQERAIEEQVIEGLRQVLGSERFQELLESGDDADYRGLLAEIRLLQSPTMRPEPSPPTESDAAIGLSDVFGDLRRHLVSAWRVQGELLVQRPLGGKSGASVLAVDIDCDAFSGQAILKLEAAGNADGDFEADRHRLAFERSPDFAARHLPRIVHAASFEGATAILATIAARGLEFTAPWEEAAYPTQLAVGRRVSAEILSEWNGDYRLAEAILDPQEVLSGWLDYRLEPRRGRIHGFLEQSGLDPLTPTLIWDGHWYPNPLAFAVGTHDEMSRLGIRPVVGNIHGDLHGFNVLVREADGALDWFLIDLAFYRPEDFLFFDHAYFELSHLLEARADRSIDRWMPLLSAIGGRKVAEGDDVGLVDLAQAMRGEADAWVDEREPDRVASMVGQMMLARVAVGLNFTHKRIPGPLKQRGFLYAMSSLKDYVRFEGLAWPRTGTPLEFG